MQSLFIFRVLVVVLSFFCVGRAGADADVDQGLSLYYPSVRAAWATAQVKPWLFNVSRAWEAVADECRRQHGSSSVQGLKAKRYG